MLNQFAATPRRSVGVFLGALFGLLVLMSYQVTDPKTHRSVLVTVLFRLFSPLQAITVQSVRSVIDVGHNYFVLVGAREENVRLKKELSELRIQLDMATKEKNENNRLRNILNLEKQLPYELIVGEVVGRDAKYPVSNTLVVNRGRRQGLHQETPVVTPLGVVGITVLVEPWTSKVQLITDASSSIGAMLRDKREAGILAGIGGGRCVLRFLPVTTSMKKGDVVVTSGQDRIFPEGLRIGKISKGVYESEFYRSAEVVPFENFSALNEVVFLIENSTGSQTAAGNK